SAITMRSQQSAMSLPPATAGPCTRAMVGLNDRHRDMKSRVFWFIMKKSAIGSQGSWRWLGRDAAGSASRRGAGRRSAYSARAALGVLDEVVAAAEALAGAGQHDDVYIVVFIGHRHRVGDLAGHVAVDGVHPLGAIEGDGGAAPPHLVGDRMELHGFGSPAIL